MRSQRVQEGKRNHRPWNKRIATARKVPMERSRPVMRRLSSQLFQSLIAERDRRSRTSRIDMVISQNIPLKRHPGDLLPGEEDEMPESIFGCRMVWRLPVTRVISHGSVAMRAIQYKAWGKAGKSERNRSRIAAPREANAARCAVASVGWLR